MPIGHGVFFSVGQDGAGKSTPSLRAERRGNRSFGIRNSANPKRRRCRGSSSSWRLWWASASSPRRSATWWNCTSFRAAASASGRHAGRCPTTQQSWQASATTEDRAETSHRAPTSLQVRVSAAGSTHPEARYQSHYDFPQTQSNADTQGKNHRARLDQKITMARDNLAKRNWFHSLFLSV
jgi:hypothetical protein